MERVRSILIDYTFDEDYYTYLAEIDSSVIQEYAISEIGGHAFASWSQEKQEGFRRAVSFFWENHLINDLEENEDFISWLRKDREQIAKKEYEREQEEDV